MFWEKRSADSLPVLPQMKKEIYLNWISYLHSESGDYVYKSAFLNKKRIYEMMIIIKLMANYSKAPKMAKDSLKEYLWSAILLQTLYKYDSFIIHRNAMRSVIFVFWTGRNEIEIVKVG